MLSFIPVFILLGAAIVVIVLQYVPRGTGLAWFASVLFAVAAWVTVIILRTRLPLSFTGQYWITLGIKNLIPAFQMDIITWPFVLTVCSLVAGVLLVSSARIGLDSTSREWAGILLVGSLGYLGVTASNILTAMFVLGSIDLAEIAVLLFSPNGNTDTQSELKYILWRISGLTLFLVAYGWQFSLSGLSDEWRTLQTGPVYLMLAACVIRLGLQPIPALSGSPRSSQNGLYVLRNLVGSLTVYAIIIQLPYYPVASIWKIVILVYLLITAFSSSIMITRNQNTRELLTSWQIAAGSLVCAVYVLGYSSAGIALSISLIILGAILSLGYPINIFSRILGFLALLGFSGLPFTPNVSGFSGFGLTREFPGVIFLIPVTVMLFVSIRVLLRKPTIENALAEQWTGILSPIGLVLPIITSWVIFLNGAPGQPIFQISIPALLAVFVCMGLFVIIKLNIFDFHLLAKKVFGKFPTWKPSYTSLFEIGRNSLGTAVQSPFNFITNLFEGEGGVLWSVLSLLLIITVIRTLGLTP